MIWPTSWTVLSGSSQFFSCGDGVGRSLHGASCPPRRISKTTVGLAGFGFSSSWLCRLAAVTLHIVNSRGILDEPWTVGSDRRIRALEPTPGSRFSLALELFLFIISYPSWLSLVVRPLQ